ncbi:alpha/beta fold hydrolase [uncultured Tateyamaria sp.]|uniref:alpha/beta fold hydrolase n=1 Tax=uncultured Tateyamaria sp. TaxID=455651 RepID=UPI002608BC5C|nr:alpha/beta hydrolase [uncultured Tateyamaria sp.]
MTWTTRQRSEQADLSAIVAGEGQNVVLLHGVGLRAEAWNAQIDSLATGYCVTAIDLPGHGNSARLENARSVSDYVDVIRRILPAKSLVVGHSFGAMIALELAWRHPDNIAGVAALNAIHKRGKEAAQAVNTRAQSLNSKTNGDPEPTLRRWFGDEETPARTACRKWLTDVDPAGYKSTYSVFAHSDGPTEAELKSICCPALFMTGGDEPNSTPAMSNSMAALAPLGRARIVPGAAHMMPMTHADAVIDALSDLARKVFS